MKAVLIAEREEKNIANVGNCLGIDLDKEGGDMNEPKYNIYDINTAASLLINSLKASDKI